MKNSFACWSAGKADDSITGIGYSELVFDVCAELGIPLLALTSHPNEAVAQSELIRVESIPDVFAGETGLGYWRAHARAAALLARRARAFEASVVAITEEISPTAALPLRALGAQLIQIRHCSLWPRGTRPSLRLEASSRVNGGSYRNGFAAVLAVSATIARQVRQVVGDAPFPTCEFLPAWREAFDDVPPPPEPRAPFRVLVAGRTIASKGIFDVLELARDLLARGHAFRFDVCGDGSDLPALERQVDERGLADVVSLHGWCPPRRLHDLLARCHAVLAPTTPQFNEGFNKVAVEACLAQRPLVVSDVCPAVEYLDDAILAYPGGDLGAGRDALIRLATDPALYAAKRSQCARVSRPFLDAGFSLRETLRAVLVSLRDGRPVEPREILGSPELAAAREEPAARAVSVAAPL